MDERTNTIRNLEAKKLADIKARNRLLEGLGEALFQRIGEGEPFGGGDTPGGGAPEAETPAGILSEYRGLQKEIAVSGDTIKSLESEVSRLKELEGAASVKEEEKTRLDAELEDAYAEIGKGLIEDPDFHDTSGVVRQQEENLLARIDEHERKLEDLETKEGGIFAWLGKNARMTVSKTALSKNRAALQKLYRAVGEKFLAANRPELASGENAFAAGRAGELKERTALLAADISGIKAECRKIGEAFGADGSPSRRINGLEKHITQTRGKFPAVNLRMGAFAAGDGGREPLSAFLRDEDAPVLEDAARIKTGIEETELAVEKIKAAIRIDDEKAEIEKRKKAIGAQRQKITAANEAITEHEKSIAETERRIEELRVFIDNGLVR